MTYKAVLWLVFAAYLGGTPAPAVIEARQAVWTKNTGLDERVLPHWPGAPPGVPDTLVAFAHTECDAEGVPWPLFCRLIGVESGWDPRARNANYEGGRLVSTDYNVMQINSFNFREFLNAYRDRHAYAEDYDLVNNPYDSLRIGIRHLADLRHRLGSWKFAVAAYNGGPWAARTWNLKPVTQWYVAEICPVENWWLLPATPAVIDTLWPHAAHGGTRT